jgi:hypothetical protein
MTDRPPGDPDPLDAETGWARIVEAIDGGVPIHVNRGEGERYAAAYVEGFDDGWSQASRSQRWPNVLALLLIIAAALAAGVALGWTVGTANAAPRPAPVIPAALGSGEPDQGRTGAPATTSDPARQAAGGAPPTAVTIPPACAPRPCDGPALVSTGLASWYRDTSLPADGLYAAAPGWRFGQTPYPVAVCAFTEGRSRCVTVFVQDACGCPNGRVIDLSPAAFSNPKDGLGVPLSVGLVRVTVERLR